MESINFRDKARFAQFLKGLSRQIGFKVSARGWAYILEQNRLINKDQFDRATNAINYCRKHGLLPIDFTAEEAARDFQGVETPQTNTIVDDFSQWLDAALGAKDHYKVDWWENEEYYIQMVVEKIDLVTLFAPVCREYHIPIANSKGWSSMLQRAEYARRFQEAEEQGLKCVLMYCGDHDPDGLRISEFIRKNLYDLRDIQWRDGTEGYDPTNLEIHRFGLNFDFIQQHGLTWIDNLITGSGKNLANPNHKNFHMPYVQEYLQDVGERKCEANAIVTMPRVARDLVRTEIESFLGEDAKDRFKAAREAATSDLKAFMEHHGIEDIIADIQNKAYEWDNPDEEE